MLQPDFLRFKPKNFLPDNMTTRLLKSSDSLAYHRTLNYYSESPLHQLTTLANWLEVNKIFIKDESARFGLKSFKALGASYAIHQLVSTQPKIQTFCTATDGNHGKAVAFSARMHQKQAVIIVPKQTSELRIKSIEEEKALVIRYDGDYDGACREAEQLSDENGWQLVQDVAWNRYKKIPALIMAGYLTLFKELEGMLNTHGRPLIDVIFLQAGVGSFAASGVWYYVNRYMSRKPKIVIVEPLQADGIQESFKQHKLSAPKGDQSSIMAGLNCGIPSSIALAILQSGVDAIIRIDDDYAREAMQMLYFPLEEDISIIAGESGAAGLAGYLAILKEDKFKPLKKQLNITKDSRLLFFNTEGDTDPESFHKNATGL